MDSVALQDPQVAAEEAGLHYVSDEKPGITRIKAGRGFAYYRGDTLIKDDKTLARIRMLAIPPAWRDVWICPDPRGHIQATGRDDKGRKQYRYHPCWAEVRDENKYGRMIEFAQALPQLRARIEEDMGKRGLSRDKVLATVVHLLETTLIRVGNEDYARANGSYGLTTLRNKHVAVDGPQLKFNFKGKSGKDWKLSIRNRRVAKVVKACQDLPGQHLFQYVDESGAPQVVTSADVNDYLREVTGRDFTAKDFRTWAGTVLAAIELGEMEGFSSASHAKRNITAAIKRVAERLGNTPTVCRKCYVHPQVVEAYLGGVTLKGARGDEVRLHEDAVLALLMEAAEQVQKKAA
jgi:DNA topoisomerase-1